jgi:hypothetical protein
MLDLMWEILQANERFIREAEQARWRAKNCHPGPERDALLREARQAEVIDRWLSSSEWESPSKHPHGIFR